MGITTKSTEADTTTTKNEATATVTIIGNVFDIFYAGVDLGKGEELDSRHFNYKVTDPEMLAKAVRKFCQPTYRNRDLDFTIKLNKAASKDAKFQEVVSLLEQRDDGYYVPGNVYGKVRALTVMYRNEDVKTGRLRSFIIHDDGTKTGTLATLLKTYDRVYVLASTIDEEYARSCKLRKVKKSGLLCYAK